MLLCIELVDRWDQILLAVKWVEVDDQSFWCLVQRPWSIEKLPPQGSHVTAIVVRAKQRRQVCYGVVHQRHQPPHQLHSAPLEPWVVWVAVLVVAWRHGIEVFVV